MYLPIIIYYQLCEFLPDPSHPGISTSLNLMLSIFLLFFMVLPHLFVSLNNTLSRLHVNEIPLLLPLVFFTLFYVPEVHHDVE